MAKKETSWESTIVNGTDSIRHAIEVINDNLQRIALIVDENKVLLGVITDGDIRRAILADVDLKSDCTKIMEKNPKYVNEGDSIEKIINLMRTHDLQHIPVLDQKRVVKNLYSISQIISDERKKNSVVLMAGGLGERLGELTKNQPKPLLKVGQKPILETTLESFIEHGFYHFYMSVNYKADMLMQHFEDGSKWGVQIEYLHEKKRLGTAGPLSLIPEGLEEPFFVMNGDLLTKIDFADMLEFHKSQKAAATMCVREYKTQVPYGVVHLNGHYISKIDEKPRQSHFVNAGIYIFEPSVLKHIPGDEYIDMPDFFDALQQKDKILSAYPLREYWVDVGRMQDFDRANREFDENFN